MKIPTNLSEMLAQAQELQENLSEAQGELRKQEVEASAGGGMVKVRMNGEFQVVAVHIESEVVDPNDVEMLQDLVRAATNEASRKAKEQMQESLSKLTGGIPIPGFSS